jgi:hypothetical protein
MNLERLVSCSSGPDISEVSERAGEAAISDIVVRAKVRCCLVASELIESIDRDLELGCVGFANSFAFATGLPSCIESSPCCAVTVFPQPPSESNKPVCLGGLAQVEASITTGRQATGSSATGTTI